MFYMKITTKLEENDLTNAGIYYVFDLSCFHAVYGRLHLGIIRLKSPSEKIRGALR